MAGAGLGYNAAILSALADHAGNWHRHFSFAVHIRRGAGGAVMMARSWSHLVCAALLALIALCVLWEGWLAPLRPGGSWLMLKVLPLLPAVPGALRGRRYTSQCLSMLSLPYFIEGAWRCGDADIVGMLARGEIVLAVGLYIAAIGHARAAAPPPQKRE